jgi:hypothetical protein
LHFEQALVYTLVSIDVAPLFQLVYAPVPAFLPDRVNAGLGSFAIQFDQPPLARVGFLFSEETIP